MFSKEKRCHYCNSPVAEVICQLRFPQILTINATPPADFQELIREHYPKYSAKTENPSGQPQNSIVNYQFSSQDNVWRVNLTSGFISLSCNQYTSWEDFSAHWDGPLVAFIKTYKPAYFERIGLRYLNFFSRKRLGLEEHPFRELFAPEFLGLMSEESIAETNFSRNSVDSDFSLGNGCRVQVHAGPGVVKRNGQPDSDVNFVLDNDFYMSGNIPVNYSAGALETLHAKSYPLFRSAITDILHNAMEPEEI